MKNNKNEDIISLRGKLVEEIVIDFCEKNWFIPFDEVEKGLQTQLDTHLKFETKISDLKQKDNFSNGSVSFNNEDNIIRVINFTIVSNNAMEVKNK